MPWPIPDVPAYPDPAPLRWYRWALLLAALLLTGVVLVLLNWPPTKPTRTPDFWLLMFGAPTVVFLIAFGLRLSVLENGRIHKDVWLECCHELRQAWMQWGQHHQVATQTVVLAPAASDVRAWFDADTPLPVNLGRGLTLTWTDAPTAEQWIAMLFGKVAQTLAPSLRPLSGTLRVSIMLDATTGQALEGDASDIGKWLAAALAQHDVRLNLTTDLRIDPGLNELDAWMDRPFDAPVLLIAAQRAADPDAPTFSEGAMAMLFDSTHARKRKGVSGVRVYRPMASTPGALGNDLAEVRRVQNPKASHVWTTAVEASMQGAWLARESDATDPPTSGWRNQAMDDVFGLPGPLSAWIALGMAAQAAALLGRAQGVIAGSGSDAATLCMVSPHGAS